MTTKRSLLAGVIAAFAVGQGASTPATAHAEPSSPPAQLEVHEQALGWWLGGSGAFAIIAGGFMLLASNGPSRDRAREIEFSGGVALGGLGAATLGAGIFTLVAAAPGPCETSGSALSDGHASSLFVTPELGALFGRPSVSHASGDLSSWRLVLGGTF